jgi:hypothetical protein
MPQISKQIVKDLIATLDAYGCGAHHPDLLPLLDQPEGEPVAHLRAKTSSVAWNSFELTPASMLNAFPVYTHPAPFTPITADDVTNAMVKQVQTMRLHDYKDIIAAAANAYMKGKQ